jgi:hypothetical protein
VCPKLSSVCPAAAARRRGYLAVVIVIDVGVPERIY